MWRDNPGLYVDFEDVMQFKKDILEGDIYSKLADIWNDKLKEDRYSRKTAKRKFLSILNSPSHFKSKERSALVKEYPRVMETFDNYSRGYFRTRKQKKNTKSIWKTGDLQSPFSTLTQKLESDFILNWICKRISDERPEAPIYTVHDSILTTKENMDYVKYVMTDESLNLFGNKVRFS